MFDIERWQEILEAISKNKLRTFLTGLSVASGIFILVILLGFGQGMRNGIAHEFEEDAATSVWVWPGETTIAYKGLNPGRYIQLRNEDYSQVQGLFESQINHMAAFLFIRGVSAAYNNEVLAYDLAGTYPNMQFIENESIIQGRFINEKDIAQRSKIIVIGRNIRDEVFENDSDVIGAFIELSGIPFKIVGVFTDPSGEGEENRMFIPMSTAQVVFEGADHLENLSFTLPVLDNFDASVAQSIQFKKDVTRHLKQKYQVAAEDTRAIQVWNPMEEAKRYFTLTDNIAFFFWFVGICTIIAGVVGVSNIMLIVVKERTKEIGIRKALGAKPWSIVAMIVHEAIFVTAVSGFGGLIFAMGLLEILGPQIEVDYILNPSVNFNVALATVVLLISSGAIAGFIPAWKSAHIHTIEALRDQ